MALPPNAATLKPFLAPLLLSRGATTPPANLLPALVAEVQAAIVSKGAVTRTNVTTSAVQASGGISVQTIEYAEKSPPAWAPLSGLEDIKHQLVVVATKGDLAAICSSDPGLRNKLGAGLAAARPVDRATIEQAFVGAQASAMWLVGVHTPTDSRPNAKTLMGTALEYALDPLGDQSFYYSAVRSRIPWQAAGGAPANIFVGAAPGSGRIWVKRPRPGPISSSSLRPCSTSWRPLRRRR
ncbi:hypothetical protein BH10PSE4_BH10PSE4_34180 [soil metagenome]